MTEAICVRCGRGKRRPWQKCRRCGLDPTADRDTLVRSVYLSTGRFELPADRGAYRETLRAIARSIEAGVPAVFDEAEIQRLRAQRDLVRRIPMSAVYGALTRLVMPALLFLAALYGVLIFLRWLRAS